ACVHSFGRRSPRPPARPATGRAPEVPPGRHRSTPAPGRVAPSTARPTPVRRFASSRAWRKTDRSAARSRSRRSLPHPSPSGRVTVVRALRNPRPGGSCWLDSLALAMSEFGQPLFGSFGECVRFLGGTLGELPMPAILVAYLWGRRNRHAAMVALWWVAQNRW